MSLKKGATITDSIGKTYTLESLMIKTQKVKYVLKEPGKEFQSGEMSVSEWKALTKPGLDKAVDNNDGTESPLITKGQCFQMMDKSIWQVYEQTVHEIAAINLKSYKKQSFTIEELISLSEDGHIKFLS
jgi:hypothetical protein